MKSSLFVVLAVFFLEINSLSQTITTSPIQVSSLCAGSTISLPFSITGTFFSGNIFTAQLSDANGNFGNVTNIGTVSSISGGSITSIIPVLQSDGNLYRIRVVGSSPSVIGEDNGSDITINSFGINAPIFSGTSFCLGESLKIGYSIQNGCNFSVTNIFSAQLSNASGSFASPTIIGSVAATNSGFIEAKIPIGTSAGSAYRIRIVSSNPGVIISADNGTNLTINSSIGNPSIFGTNAWNVYSYNGTAFPINDNNFLGTYTENNLSFDTKDRWIPSVGPESANASTGSAYLGCPSGSINYSLSFKRTNFSCGYYQIDISFQDDGLTLFIDDIIIFQNNFYTPFLQNNVWTGFLGPNSTIEFQLINYTSDARLSVDIKEAPNPLSISDPVVICTTSSSLLNVSSEIPLSYTWSPITGLSPSDGLGENVLASPLSSTTYTATGTDLLTGCSVSNNVDVTVISALTMPTLSLTNIPASICPGITSSTLSVNGANNYTWSPSTGLNKTSGSKVIASPLSTTTYTVTGSTGCQTATISTTVTVQPAPISPPDNFGDRTWNVYCHNNTTLSNYYGYYAEDNLSFKTTSRWASDSGPTVANGSSGIAYSGCTFGSSNYSMSFKRTNFTCGYYQIDIPFQDDVVKLFINGIQVFQNSNYTPSLQTNVWTGFLGPTTTIEIQFINYQLLGHLEISITPSSSNPQALNTNSSICVGTSANLSAISSVLGATYEWSVTDPSNTMTFLPNSTVANPILQTTGATPSGDYLVTSVLKDAVGTGCTNSQTTVVTVSDLPNTSVNPISITSVLTNCTNLGVILTANGANTYSWSPSIGLNQNTGFSVVASPLVTTTYTVTGSNNCSTKSASTTVIVSPLPSIDIFPSDTWSVYGFNSDDIGSNYEGYYTDNGFGPTGLSFDTRTRWAYNDVPSTANSSNGMPWQGCEMNKVNTSLSIKRSGFSCGLYRISVPSHKDGFVLFINGSQVAMHNGCCDNHTNIWTGVLDEGSRIEWQLFRNSNESFLQVEFVQIERPVEQAIWLGSLSSDWFDFRNWCGELPSLMLDVMIYSSGVKNMPVIDGSNAAVRNITISSGFPGGVYTNAISPANLTINNVNLDVYGDWINNGLLNTNSSSISFVGTNKNNIISSALTETFNDIIIDKLDGISISSGTHQVSGKFKLANGIVKQKANLRILKSGSVLNASNNSYVNGMVTKVGSTAFIFPIGDGGFYRPISISAPVIDTDVFSAEYFNKNPDSFYPLSLKSESLSKVSGVEYWMLNKMQGESNVKVTLSWGVNSETISSLNLLSVAAWNGSIWLDKGNGGTTGSIISGSVSTTVPTAVYGAFTLSEIKLPVGLAESPNISDIVLYPNPTSNYAIVELNGIEFESLIITNTFGQILSCPIYYGMDYIEINTTTLTPGLYILYLFVNERPLMKKIIIHR